MGSWVCTSPDTSKDTKKQDFSFQAFDYLDYSENEINNDDDYNDLVDDDYDLSNEDDDYLIDEEEDEEYLEELFDELLEKLQKHREEQHHHNHL